MSDGWEWLPVAGTLGGAAIGGVVTVVSLWVKGNQDSAAAEVQAERQDRLRADDRDWSLRQRNVDERRAAFSDLLLAADYVAQGAGMLGILRLGLPGQAEYDEYAKLLTPDVLVGQFNNFEAAASKITLLAVDDDILRAVLAYKLAATEVIRRLNDPSSAPDTTAKKIERLVVQSHRLRDLCRRDLGLRRQGIAGVVLVHPPAPLADGRGMQVVASRCGLAHTDVSGTRWVPEDDAPLASPDGLAAGRSHSPGGVRRAG